MASESGDFDTERFISEVESRSALWDMNSEEYSNRDMRKSSWEEIVEKLMKNKGKATAAEKNEFAKVLQRKWKSLRDCYARERQKAVRAKSSGYRKTQYVFYNRLSFLQSNAKPKETTTSREDQVSPDAEETSGVEENRKVKKKKTEKTAPEKLLDVIQSSIKSREEREKEREEDEDRMFLLSLLSPMKKIPKEMGLPVRMQIMQVIDAASRPNMPVNSIGYVSLPPPLWSFPFSTNFAHPLNIVQYHSSTIPPAQHNASALRTSEPEDEMDVFST